MKAPFTSTNYSFKHLCLITLVVATVTAKMTWKIGSHDNHCYTQGLSFINQTHLLQSCGMYGESYFQIHNYNPIANTFTTTYKSSIFGRQYFLQGSIFLPSNQIFYILTWQEHIVFRYRYIKELAKFESLPQLTWNFEGWGMTHNNTHIFISDGSEHIYVTNSDLQILQTLSIKYKGVFLQNINELQWVEQNGKQYIYTNVYMQDIVVKINIAEQKAVQMWDLMKLKETQVKRGRLKLDQVLNGIAIYKSKIVVTGKYWRSFFSAQFLKV